MNTYENHGSILLIAEVKRVDAIIGAEEYELV